jgi:TonB family protein
MQSPMRSAPEKTPAPFRGLQFLLEPEPWLCVFARNLGDLFRPAPPPVWITSKPEQYWPDALVHRPVAWRAARQSFLLHLFAALAIYAINLAWLEQPRIVPPVPSTSAALHYELSEYLPAVAPRSVKPEPPRRARPQKADPEYAAQEIVVTNENHISTRQAIVQPSPLLLKQDVPLPNLIVSTPVPGAPVAGHHPVRELPLSAPEIAPPATQVAQSSLHPLVFPPAAQPVVAAPSAPIVASRPTRVLPLEGPIVVAPAPETAARNLNLLKIPAQAPPAVAAPSTEIATGRSLQSLPLPTAGPQVAPPSSEIASGRPLQPLPVTAPQVAPPATAATGRNLSSLGLPLADHAAAAPAPPVSAGGSAREKELGQLLVLNAQPVVPVAPVTVPQGNRPGEFAASPEGRPGATARPEIKAGAGPSPAGRSGSNSGPGEIYVSPPPAKITANAVMAAPPRPPTARPLTPDRTEGQPHDRIDTQIFGTRRHYSMKLSMPNLSSSVGSWTIRFAEMNATGPSGPDLSAPEAISKVDPAYPQDLMHDRVEGVVVLYAIIRSDGTVDGVRVLEGFDERLNENARKALQQWRFRPGTKDGQPVDIEAVVRVPFRVPRASF